jgi:hypothetical protein
MAWKDKTGHRERLRHRFIEREDRALTDQALLELLLTYAVPRKDVQPIVKELINQLGSLSNVLSADIVTLSSFKGVGEHSAILIKLIDWIRSRYAPQIRETTISLPNNKQGLLFNLSNLPQKQPPKRKERRTIPRRKALPTRETRLLSNAVLKETITLLPDLPETESLEEIRDYLMKSLPQSAEQTRQRYANYIIQRMFPNRNVDRAMRIFARHFRESRALQEVCFYRFLKAEPLLQLVVEEVFLPSVGNGRINREKIRDYLAKRFQASRNIKKSAQAIADAMKAGGVAAVDSTKISFTYRDIPIPTFAFVLHNEFSKPDMYDIAQLEGNKTIRAMLWNPERVLPSLYELRNLGIISKVSEIDNVRQFTLKWNLDQVVAHLAKAD